MIGQPVLPSFLSVEDDPTLHTLEGVELSGNYTLTKKAKRANELSLIANGVLKQFLMSRMPVKGFLQSNGHGRGQAG